LKFSFPRIDAGLNINIQDCGILEIDNLSARRNLNIFVSKGRLSFGKGCFVNNNCSFNCLELIEVGRNSIFGEGVKIYDHDHLITDGYCVHKNEFLTAPIKIGENCWIGSNTIILKGVIIANNVIIGANSLVNKSILEPGVYVNKNSKLIKIK
jgi:acetyltransferase-like isoleucine patch superfamily enzyme